MNPFTPWERWLAWLDSHDGRLYRRQKGGNETDGDIAATLPDPPGQRILTVGDLRRLVEANRTVRRHIAERLQQHRENLCLWQTGYLNPTEPDPQERECVVRELKAAVAELETLTRIMSE